MRSARLAVVAAVLVLIAGVGTAASFGVSPVAEDFGTVQPGATLEGRIYVSSSFSGPFRVDPQVNRMMPSSVYGANNPLLEPAQYSDRNISGWFRFPGDGRITPSTYDPPPGISNDTVGVIPYRIVVPQDADPGYHSATIDINPQTGAEGGGTAAVVRAVSQHEVYLRVAGEAVRSISVEGARAFRTGEQQVRIDVLFRNQGTVTTRIAGGTVEVRDNSGDLVASFPVDRMVLDPGERRYQTITWQGGTVGAGSYRLSVSADYRTDTAFGEFSISIPQAVEIVPSEARNPNQQLQQQEDGGVPFWLVALALVLTGILLYSFEVDPVWILVIVGGLGITAFILMSGVPNMMIVGLLLAGLAAYYVV